MLRHKFYGMPPSVNKLYVSNGFGGKCLSKEGRKFKNSLQSELALNWFSAENQDEVNLYTKDTMISLVIVIGRPVYTKGYLAGKTNVAKFANWDSSNLVKVIEDAVFETLSLSDAQTTRLVVSKMHCAYDEPQWIEVCVDGG